MTCDWCEERFEQFIDGELTAGDRARVLAHTGDCSGCLGLLEELRVVDALLLQPRSVDLPPDFTHATMADVNAMPAPCPLRSPIVAMIVAYVAGAWSLAGAAFLIAPQHTMALAKSALAVASTVFAAFGGLGHVIAHLNERGDVSSLTTVAGGVIIAEGIVLIAVIVAVRAIPPRIAERLRW